MAVERQIVVNAPVDRVYSYLADLTQHPEWASNPLEVTQTSEGPVQVGTTYTAVGQMFGKHTAQVKVTELAPNSKIVFEAEDDTGHFRHYFQMESDGGDTKLTKGMEPLRMSFLSKLLVPFLAGMAIQGDLRRIKEKLEAS